MASGSFDLTRTSGSKYVLVWLEWTSKSNGSAANTSTVTVTMKAKRTNTGYTTYGTGTFTISIDGTSYSSGSKSYSITSNTVTLYSASKTVSHNADGKKSIVISATYTGNSPIGGNGSRTVTLDNIPRYATVNQTLASKTETSVTMNWKSDSTIDYIWYSTNNGSSWTGINVTDGTSGGYTVSGLSAGTNYKIKTRVRRKDSQLTTDSSALSVDTYAYPYANSMPNFTIGDRFTIGLYNPLGRSVTVNILGADDSQISNDTTTGTSITGYNGNVVVERLYQSIPNAKSGTYKVKVTYGSQITTKTGGTYSVNESSNKPTSANPLYRDVNSYVVGITGSNQKIVQNQSTVEYRIGGLVAQNYATISSVSVSVNGNTYNLTLTTDPTGKVNGAIGGNAAIDSGNDVVAVFTITDSRGIQTTKEINITILAWEIPSAIITLNRRNNYYSLTDINVDADYSSIDGKNSVNIAYRYKQTTEPESGFSQYFPLDDDTPSTFTADNKFAWDVQVEVSDVFNGRATYNLLLPIGMPIVYFDRILLSTGFNCFPKYEKSVEINGVLTERNVMSRSLSAQITDLSVNTYTIIPLDLDVTAGSRLTATNDGGIKIGAGISKVLVSGNMALETVTTAGNRHLRIVKNAYSAANTLGWGWDNLQIGDSESITINPQLVEVQEDDVIYLYYYTGNTADRIGGNAYGGRTSLTVEAVE